MATTNKETLIKSIADIIVSQPKRVIGLLNAYGFKAPLNTDPNKLGQITIAAISKSKKFAEKLADMIIAGDFSANGDKEGTVVLMGRTFGAKKPFFNARGMGAEIDVIQVEEGIAGIIAEKALNEQIAMDAAINQATATVLGGEGMSIGVKIALSLAAAGAIFGILKMTKVI